MPLLRIHLREQTFEATLPDAAVRVGTGPLCDLTLAAEGVASEHCVLEPMVGGAWRLKDLGSGRGTRINGTEVKQASLTPGDEISVGEARLFFAPDLAPVAASAVAPARPAVHAAVPAAPLRPAVPVPAPALAPASASAELSAAAPASAGPAAAASEMSAARAPAPVPVAAASGSGGRRLLLPVLLVLLAGGVLAALGLLAPADDGTARAARARRDLDVAVELYRARDYLGARAALAALAERERAGDVQREAATWLASANQAVAQAEAELDGWVTRALDFDLGTASSRSAVFVEQHGEGFRPRLEQTLVKVRGEQDRWRASEAALVAGEVAPLLAASHYREARARWIKAEAGAPRGVSLTDEAQAGLAHIDEAAQASASALLERVGKAAQYRGAAAAAEMLAPAMGHYEGTVVHGRLAETLAQLQRDAAQATPAAPTPEPGAPTAPGPRPTQPGPVPGSVQPDAAEVLARAQREVAAHVGTRAFAAAVEALDRALAQVGEGPAKTELTLRRVDLALARNGLDTLAGEITADPRKFGRVEMSEKLFASPTAADRDGVTCAVSGGTTKLRWATMRLALVVELAERMQPGVQDALAVAALLHELGAAAASEAMLVRAGEGAGDRASLFQTLARWRGEEVPAGGYVVYENRFVSPVERDRLILEGRIRGGLERLATARNPAQRQAAFDELTALGESAREPLVKALASRRAQLVDEIVGDNVWSASRTRQKLFELLEQRRAHALALIDDQAAYPYPNPNHMGQAEVERRVDEVREVWERPFRLVASFDESVQAALTLLVEVDEAMAKVSPGHKPDLSDLETRAARAVDMPAYAPPGSAGGVREYSLKVLAYNERVATSATREEKDNVRAVNEYRMMMGRQAVKIEERLVRAARGHSRHMNQNGYFAHDAPAQFPEVRSPGQRARRQGYGGGVGENIAMGTPSGRDAFWAWFGSSGHHRNMLGRGWLEMGAGRSVPHHWTQLFGAAGGKSLDEPGALPAPAPDVAPDPDDTPGSRPQQPITPRVPDEKPPGEEPEAPSTPGPGG